MAGITYIFKRSAIHRSTGRGRCRIYYLSTGIIQCRLIRINITGNRKIDKITGMLPIIIRMTGIYIQIIILTTRKPRYCDISTISRSISIRYRLIVPNHIQSPHQAVSLWSSLVLNGINNPIRTRIRIYPLTDINCFSSCFRIILRGFFPSRPAMAVYKCQVAIFFSYRHNPIKIFFSRYTPARRTGIILCSRPISRADSSSIIPIYNPQIQISAESETKRSIFREKDKTKRSKKESAQHSKSRNKSFVMTSVSAL